MRCGGLMKSCTHPGECRIKLRKKADGPYKICLTREALRAKAYRGRFNVVDGLEDEYGPCPNPVPDSKWYDEVAVDNAVLGGLSRALTPPEMADYIKRTRSWTLDEVAVGIAAAPDKVQNLRTRYADA